MLNLSLGQKITVKFILYLTRFLNFINIEIKWVFFTLFTVILSLTFWNFKNYSLDDFMRVTRRKPVLSLSETIPSSVLRLDSDSKKTSVSAFEKIIENKVNITAPAIKLLSVKPINLLARSYVVYDYKNNREIVSRDKDLVLPPASLVKILSVMYFSRDLNFSDRFKMTQECTLVNGQKVGFRVDESVSVKDLVYSSLIYSGADAICLLSRTNDSLNLDGFNNYAKSLGLKNSNFTNYIGLDFTDNVTTSEDMLILTKEFLKKDIFSEIVKIKSYELENKKVIYNTNKMLFSEKYSAGVKTGTTDGANENLIYRYKDESKDIDLLIVILNSANRYSDVKQVIENLYFN